MRNPNSRRLISMNATIHTETPPTTEETPLLESVAKPSLSEKPPQMPRRKSSDSGIDDETFQIPSWTRFRTDKNGRQMPQAIAHRGYKAQFPENTMASMQGAVEIGAHALETDIHLTSDDVVVLSHDPDLKRCFGQPEKIKDCTWSHISTLRTIKEPPSPMPRLTDLLTYLSDPSLDHIWLLLDIKLDNPPEKVMSLIAAAIASTPPSPSRPWSSRIVLGIWAAKYLPLCRTTLPGFPISHIGFSTCYARQFLKVPGVSFNMLQRSLMNPFGTRFIRDVQKNSRPLFLWTVNETNFMKWSIRKNVDGVITDDPKLFNEIVENWDPEEKPQWPGVWQSLYTLWLWILIATFSLMFRRKFPERAQSYLRVRQLKAKATLHLGA